GADGLITRWEQFEVDCEAEGLARFDELTAEPPAVCPTLRRVRPNAATAYLARLDAAVAACDADALPALFADEVEGMDHINGVCVDRQGLLGTWRTFLKAENPTVAQETLATLGEALLLCRWSMSASGFVGKAFDVGAYEQAEITLIEVDEQERER